MHNGFGIAALLHAVLDRRKSCIGLVLAATLDNRDAAKFGIAIGLSVISSLAGGMPDAHFLINPSPRGNPIRRAGISLAQASHD
jgi:hypothetical protein